MCKRSENQAFTLAPLAPNDKREAVARGLEAIIVRREFLPKSERGRFTNILDMGKTINVYVDPLTSPLMHIFADIGEAKGEAKGKAKGAASLIRSGMDYQLIVSTMGLNDIEIALLDDLLKQYGNGNSLHAK